MSDLDYEKIVRHYNCSKNCKFETTKAKSNVAYVIFILGKSQCASVCNSDFDCRWGQACEYGICAKNAEVHWKCDGTFNDPLDACKRQSEQDSKYHYCI